MIHRIVLFLKFAPSSEDFNRTFMEWKEQHNFR